MSTGPRPPTAVLSQCLAEALAGRRVRSAVFTTFTFDPGFFELQILPLLFPAQSFSQVEKVRLLQLEDALRAVDHLAIYYDRSALSQDAEPARLDYRRIDVRRATGAFHPKLILLLVDEPPEAPEEPVSHQSLLIGCLSANLTRAGWWENVECAHLEALKDKDVEPARCPFRRDLLAVLRRIRDCATEDDDQAALDAVHAFVRKRVSKETYQHASADGQWYTRLFGGEGRRDLPDWLRDASLHRHEWNLEVISPYFDANDARPLDALIDALEPRETRVWLPREPDGSALVTQAVYEAVSEHGAHWSELPPELLERSRGTGGERLAPRRVHAKVYRLWHRDGRHVVLTGSVNCTRPGHGHGGAGNLEAAFLVDLSASGLPRRWWLEPLETEAKRFAERAPGEDEGLDTVPIDVTFRFDWATGALAYRLEKAVDRLEVESVAGVPLFALSDPIAGRWVDCPAEAAVSVREQLPSSSFLVVKVRDMRWRVLVREERMAYRPSILSELTPEEILEYWSLLTAEQRATFLERHGAFGEQLEGIPAANPEALEARDTLFDRFSGVYHAFGCLRRHVEEALAQDRAHEAEALLLGTKYDSLPELLRKTLVQEDIDPVVRYVTFLSARQLREGIARHHRMFFQERRDTVAHLDGLLEQLADLRDALPLGEDGEGEAFLAWYEEAFLEDLSAD